jgi:hypothetical protein
LFSRAGTVVFEFEIPSTLSSLSTLAKSP